MAFVPANALPTGARPAPVLGAQLATTPLRSAAPSAASPPANAPTMGYGDYSYLTDKTKGHVNQYYVDKFRVTADWKKGTPKTDADAPLGRTAKGAVFVPADGVPQEFHAPIAPFDSSVAPDPRVAEADGIVWPWDTNYVDPEFLPSTYADVNDADVADTAFAQFRSSLWEDRREALSAQDFGAVARVQRIKAGIDEKYLMTFDGMMDTRYAVFQDICEPAVLTPTGEPMTEIPGFPYLNSVGAMDFIEQEEETIAFWKADIQKTSAPVYYKKPSGNQTPDLAYNVAPTIAELNIAQKAQEAKLTIVEGSVEEE